MVRFKLIVILFLLTSSILYGQENNSVEIYEGRRAFFNSQVILDLSYQNLESLPVEATNSDIEVLILDNNNIEKLPNWIGQLKNLKVLSVRNNNLKELNYAITLCDNLEQLYLSGNKTLSDLPSLRSCKNLKIIDVIDTGINDLPGSIQWMDNLLYFKYSK